ncbi:hypothetical protein [Tunicatimonas pelagia]|uniref:hypothetical protein n=1 Tax=Tunicatimonas pelagia TaxID=931531 RepID=UPI00266539D3|nr:hypothetical protein [Tunicatimonas pelagia]WKN43262.1 hypothetical protein P0M28_29910 [Tunicatimonas pelagia]
MRGSNWLFNIFLSLSILLLTACNSDEDSASWLNQDHLVGLWDLEQVSVQAKEGQTIRSVYQRYYESLGVPASEGLAIFLDSLEAIYSQPITDLYGEGVHFLLEEENNSFLFYENRLGSTQGWWSVTNNNQLTIEETGRTSRFTVASLNSFQLVLNQDAEDFNNLSFLSYADLTIPEGAFVKFVFSR